MNKVSCSYRIDPQVKEMLEKICEFDNRSQTHEIEHLIKTRYFEMILKQNPNKK